MRTVFFTYAVAGGLLLGQGLAAQALKPITVELGPATLIENGGESTNFAMTGEDYQKLAAQVSKNPAFVAITKKPAGVNADMRFGINLVLAGKNCGWALSGNDADGYIVYPDGNANGDLTDDAPLKMTLVDGKYVTYFETVGVEDGTQYPIRSKLVVDRVAPPGSAEKALVLLNYNSTRRVGEVILDGAPMKFLVTGASGLYDRSAIRLDLNRDGAFDPVIELYRASEKYFNVGDKTYEFTTDRYGRSVTFTPLAEMKPARVVLLPGYPAPEISFADLDGKARKLSDFKGSVVLIDFWGTWCGPCVASTPGLVAAYKRYHPLGLEIIGVDSSDTKEQLTKFMTEHGMSWPQTMEDAKGPLATLFRVSGWPTYFLIDRDGKFTSAGQNGNFQLEVELAKVFKNN